MTLTLTKFTFTLPVMAKKEDEQRVFGWANVTTKNGGIVVDSQDDIIRAETLEKAAYEFVENVRTGGEMHRKLGVADLCESFFASDEKAPIMLAAWIGRSDIQPVMEGWWVGFHVSDPDVWAKVKSGEYPMFSIAGTATREPVE